MIKKVTNFVLYKLHKRITSVYGTNEGGRKIRKTRLKRFRKKGKRLIVAAQIVAVWYLLILTGSYLTTSDTGAYFNDEEKISGTFSTAKDFCEGLNGSSEYWHKYCKDNSGGGNGPEPGDENTGETTDPDNPGHNKDGCDDHTNAPCSQEVTDLKEEHTSNTISLTWTNPTKDFDYVIVYRDDDKNPVGAKITNGQFKDENLTPAKKYVYKITTVNTSGKESSGSTQEVTTGDATKDEGNTGNDETDKKLQEEVTKLSGSRNGNSANIDLSWKNPTGISFVRIYEDSNKTPIADNVKGEDVKLKSDNEVTYRVATVDASGNESAGVLVTIK